MKNIKPLSFSFLLVLSACTGGQTRNSESGVDSDSIALAEWKAENETHEVRGFVGDGSSMNYLEVITADTNDTLNIEISNTLIAGGVKAGDDIDVIYTQADGELVSSIAINVSSLEHLWTQPSSQGGTQSLEIDHDGHATTYNMPGIDYDRWSLLNGQLLLHSPRKAGIEQSGYTDTFDILMLTADTLVLGHHAEIKRFWREN